MDNNTTFRIIHKLYVDFEGEKFIQPAKSNILIIKLLKKFQKTYASCFPNKKVPKFELITEDGYTVPLLCKVGEIFDTKAYLKVYELEEPRVIRSEKIDSKLNIFDEQRNILSKNTKKEDHKREEANKEDESKKTEYIRDDSKKEEIRKEEVWKDTKLDIGTKKKSRHERNKDVQPTIKYAKIEDDKKVATLQIEKQKKDNLDSSSITDSDADIFVKDEKKPTIAKSNIFR